jgi:hypothetical protein
MVPSVQVTAVLASTRKFDGAADTSALEGETCLDELRGPVGSLHAAESSVAKARRPHATDLGDRTRCVGKLRVYTLKLL